MSVALAEKELECLNLEWRYAKHSMHVAFCLANFNADDVNTAFIFSSLLFCSLVTCQFSMNRVEACLKNNQPVRSATLFVLSFLWCPCLLS